MAVNSRIYGIMIVLVSTSISGQSDILAQNHSLHNAVQDGNVKQAEKLLKEGSDVNQRDEEGFTPIFYASTLRMVEMLLSHKPQLNIRDVVLGETPLEKAAKERYLVGDTTYSEDELELQEKELELWQAIIKKLRAAGAEYTVTTAIYLDDINHVQKKLKQGTSWVNHYVEAPMSPLRLAAHTSRAKICKLLLDHEADPDDFAGGGGYPIMVNAINKPKIVKLLVDAGANLRRRISWRGGRTGIWIIGEEATALHFAAREGNLETAKILLKAGLDVNAADTYGQTPLHVALQSSTPIDASDKQMYLKLVRFLLEHEASLYFTDKSGKTVLDIAKERRVPKPVQQLLEVYRKARDRGFVYSPG